VGFEPTGTPDEVPRLQDTYGHWRNIFKLLQLSPLISVYATIRTSNDWL